MSDDTDDEINPLTLMRDALLDLHRSLTARPWTRTATGRTAVVTGLAAGGGPDGEVRATLQALDNRATRSITVKELLDEWEQLPEPDSDREMFFD